MGDPTIADVMEMLKSLTTEMKTMKDDMAAMQEKSASSSDRDVGGRLEGPRDLDRPPRFQKLDFPHYDGKIDLMLFINKCESYFHQQRTMTEERVWMASYNLEDVAQLWYIQLQEDEGTPPYGCFKELLHLRFAPPPSDRLRCSSSPSACVQGLWRSTPIGFRPSCLARGIWMKLSESSSSPADSCRP
jgi:hypothetical protein